MWSLLLLATSVSAFSPSAGASIRATIASQGRTAGASAVLEPLDITSLYLASDDFADQQLAMINSVDPSVRLWGSYGLLATWKVVTALTSDNPEKRGSPAGVAVWLLLTGSLVAAIGNAYS